MLPSIVAFMVVLARLRISVAAIAFVALKKSLSSISKLTTFAAEPSESMNSARPAAAEKSLLSRNVISPF